MLSHIGRPCKLGKKKATQRLPIVAEHGGD
jgi:hypothetical protein